MMKIFGLLFLFVCTGTAFAQGNAAYEKKLFVQGNDTLPYRVLLPHNFDPAKAYPLVLFLHGAGERGNDNEKQLIHGSQMFLRDSIRNNYPAIVIFPQCAVGDYWATVGFSVDTATNKRQFKFMPDSTPVAPMRMLLAFHKYINQQYRIDQARQYLGGLSMGGMGTFELAYRLPDTFAAAFAICGGADTTTAASMTKTRWWIFHGLEDPVVNPQLSKDMAKALQAHGAEVKLTLYTGVKHDSWTNAFAEPQLFPWLFAERLKK